MVDVQPQKTYITFESGKTWSHKECRRALGALASAKKDQSWVCADLSIKSSSCLGQFFWHIIKSIPVLRSLFYNVDLEKTRSLLLELKQVIDADASTEKSKRRMQNLFKRAVNNFEKIAPNHALNRTEVEAPSAAERGSAATSANKFVRQYSIGNVKILLHVGRIEKERLGGKEGGGAVVNAANEKLRGGTGIDGAIHAAAGPSVLEACEGIRKEREREDETKPKRKPDSAPCEAVATHAGNLDAQYIIHTVGPRWDEKKELAYNKDRLFNAYTNTLILAKQLGVKKIALPALSTGVFGYGGDRRKLAAETSLEAVTEFLKANPNCFEEVRFVYYNDYESTFIETELNKLDASQNLQLLGELPAPTEEVEVAADEHVEPVPVPLPEELPMLMEEPPKEPPKGAAKE